LTEPNAPTTTSEPRVHPDRPLDPKTAELRAEKNSVKRLGKALGPGLITGASDDDPSGIGTYSQAGAQHGFATLCSLPGRPGRPSSCIFPRARTISPSRSSTASVSLDVVRYAAVAVSRLAIAACARATATFWPDMAMSEGTT